MTKSPIQRDMPDQLTAIFGLQITLVGFFISDVFGSDPNAIVIGLLLVFFGTVIVLLESFYRGEQ